RKEVKAFNKLVQYASLVFRTAQKMGVITINPMKLVVFVRTGKIAIASNQVQKLLDQQAASHVPIDCCS
ncbi:hypothetical protein, partial [Levilactobacillus namurensis]|nr:hypothetical protein [Levilactobacillus namurensis]